MKKSEFVSSHILLVICTILSGLVVNTANATTDYTKRFLRGLYGGGIENCLGGGIASKHKTNHDLLNVNFLYGYDAPSDWASPRDFCSEESYPGNAVGLYSGEREGGGESPPASLSYWKNTTVTNLLDKGSFPNVMSHSLGEETPGFFDPLYCDAMNYVIPRVQAEYATTDFIACNVNLAVRPEMFLWTKGIDLIWFYTYPFIYGENPPTTATQNDHYQDYLTNNYVTPLNRAYMMVKNVRKWGTSPDLHMNVVFQAYQNPDYDTKHIRKPTREEIFMEGWLIISRGAKGLAPFLYQNQNPCGWVGLVDNDGNPNIEETDNYAIADVNKNKKIEPDEYLFCVEEGHIPPPPSLYYDGDDLFTYVKDLFDTIRRTDDNLKDYCGFTNGLYDLELDTFLSVKNSPTTSVGPLWMVNVTSLTGEYKNQAYYELASFNGSNGSCFMILNKSLHIPDITFKIQVAVPWAGQWRLVDLTKTPPDEYPIRDCSSSPYFWEENITVYKGKAKFFYLKFVGDGGSGLTTLTSTHPDATGFCNGRKFVLDNNTQNISFVYADGTKAIPQINYAHSTNGGSSWEVWDPLLSNSEYPAIAKAFGQYPVIAFRKVEGGKYRYVIYDHSKGLTANNPLTLRSGITKGSPPSIASFSRDGVHFVYHVAFTDESTWKVCHYIVDPSDFNSPKLESYELDVTGSAPERPSVVCDSSGKVYIFFTFKAPGDNASYIYVWNGTKNGKAQEIACKLLFTSNAVRFSSAYVEDPKVLFTWISPTTGNNYELRAKHGVIQYRPNWWTLPVWDDCPSGEYEVVETGTSNRFLTEPQPMGVDAALWQSYPDIGPVTEKKVHFSCMDANYSTLWKPSVALASSAWDPQSEVNYKTYKYATSWTSGSSAPFTVNVNIGSMSQTPGGGTSSDIKVLYPNGGQNFDAGSWIPLVWISSLGNPPDRSLLSSWRIFISTNGGSDWQRIEGTQIRNFKKQGNKYSLEFRAHLTSHGRVKVADWDGNPYDISDADFKVGVQDCEIHDRPFLCGVQPPGSRADIVWEETSMYGLSGIKFDYSVNNGNTWIENNPTLVGKWNLKNTQSIMTTGGLYQPEDSLLLDTLFPSDSTDTAYLYKYWGTISWTIPDTPTSAASIKLTMYDTLGDSSISIQDKPFVIPLPGGWAKNTIMNQDLWGPNESGNGIDLFYSGIKDGDTNTPIIYHTLSQDGYSFTNPDSFGIGIYPCHQRGLALWLSKTKDTIFSSYWNQSIPRWSPAGTIVTRQPGMDSTLHSPIGLDIDADTVHAVFERNLKDVDLHYDNLKLIHFALNRNNLQIIHVDTIIVGSTSMTGPVAELSPSVQALSGKVVVAYQKNDGTCWFAQKPLTGAFTAQQIGSGRFPVVAMSEGNVVYSYLAPDGKSLIRMWRYVDDTTWIGRDTIGLGDSVSILAGQKGIHYNVQLADTEICKTYIYDPLGKRILLNGTYPGAYPHASIWGEKWNACYTAQVDTFRFVKTEVEEITGFLPVLYQEAKNKRSPYTQWRDTCLIYDSTIVDYGADSLKYTFNRLNPTLNYAVMVEFYYESDTADTNIVIANIGGKVDTVVVPSNTYMWHYVELPSASSGFTLKLYKLNSGDFLTVSRLVVGHNDASNVMMCGNTPALDPNKITFCLYQPFPNPFSDAATIRYAVPYETNVSLKVYDVSGRLVNKLQEGKVAAGIHTVRWEGKDNLNRKCASGVYFVRFVAKDYVAARKMVMIK